MTTVGELRAALDDENLSDSAKLLFTSQDGAVWEDISVSQTRIEGEEVGLVELMGDGDSDTSLPEGDDALDFVMTGLDSIGEDFDE